VSQAGGLPHHHTGSLTGKDELYRALFNQAGIQEIGSSADLGNVVKAFLYLPSFTGNRVVVITPTGAGGIMTLDAMEKHGFEPSVLSKETVAKIAHLFRPWKSVSNPLDILSAGMAHGTSVCTRRYLKHVLPMGCGHSVCQSVAPLH